MQQVYTIPSGRNALSKSGILRVYFDAFSSKNRYGTTFTSDYDQGCFIVFECCSFTGKERDEETGYGYFGARYMDHELMTMWLSVDPMTNKYPSISPYAYCAWNPVKLVDPDGREFITPGYEINEKGELIRVIKDDKYDYFVVRQNNGKRIVGPKYDNGTINKGQSYARRTKKHGSVMVDRYYIKSGLARDGCLQFLADNTNIEWSAFGYSDGTSCLITSHCQYSEYGATDIINAESGIYGEARRLSERQRLENSEGWSLHAFSGLLKITSFAWMPGTWPTVPKYSCVSSLPTP